MDEHVLLVRLEQDAQVANLLMLPSEDFKKILAHIKNLERCLGEALALAHGKNYLESEARRDGSLSA